MKLSDYLEEKNKRNRNQLAFTVISCGVWAALAFIMQTEAGRLLCMLIALMFIWEHSRRERWQKTMEVILLGPEAALSLYSKDK